VGRHIQLAQFQSGRKVGSYRVKDMGLGRVALQAGAAWASVDANGGIGMRKGQPGNAESFQWIETPTGELVLMSLVTNRFLRVDPATQALRADSPGPLPDGSDGVRFTWTTVGR
jgi:hypothetical protein